MSKNICGSLTMNCQLWSREWVFQFTSIFSNAPLIVLREGYCCSVAKSCPTFFNPWTTVCQAPSLPPRVCSNSCPLSQWWYPTISYSASSSHPHFPQHQTFFQWVSSSPQVAKVLEFQLQHQSFQWTVRTDILKGWLVWFPCTPRDCQESSPTPQLKSVTSLVLSLLYGSTLISVPDNWKNHSSDYMDLCQQSDVSAF